MGQECRSGSMCLQSPDDIMLDHLPKHWQGTYLRHKQLGTQFNDSDLPLHHGIDYRYFNEYFGNYDQFEVRSEPQFAYEVNLNLPHSAMHFFLRFLADDLQMPRKNHEGLYPIRLHVNGEERTEVVDGRVPLLKGIPLFGKTNCKDVWMWQVQKAWLKIKRSDKALPDQAQHVLGLAGRPVHVGWVSTGYWNFHRQSVLAFSSSSDNSRPFGIIPGCLYKLQKQLEFKGQKAYLLRNPTGPFQFKGALSASTPGLSEVLQEHNIVLEQKSQFFLCQKSEVESLFQQYFEVVEGIKLAQDELEPTSNYYQLEVSQKQASVSLFIYQQSGLDPEQPEGKPDGSGVYSQVVIDLMTLGQGHVLLHEGSNSSHFGAKCVFVSEQSKIKLRQGKYVVHVLLRKPNPHKKFIKLMGTPGSAKLSRMNEKVGLKHKQLMFQGETEPGKCRWLKHRCLVQLYNGQTQQRRCVLQFKQANGLQPEDMPYKAEDETLKVEVQLEGYEYRTISLVKRDLSQSVQNFDAKTYFV